MDKILSVRETAEYLGVSTSTIYRYAKKNEIPYIKKKFGLRFRQSEIEKWIDQDKRKTSISNKILIQALTNPFASNIDKAKGGIKRMANPKKGRQNYGYGAVYVRKTKKGYFRFYIDYYDKSGNRKQKLVKNATCWRDAELELKNQVLMELSKDWRLRERKHDIKFRTFAEIYLQKHCKRKKKAWERSDKVYLHANLIPFFGDCDLAKIGVLLIEDFIGKRFDDRVKRSTINRDLACLKKMFNKAIDWGYTTSNPVKKIKLFSEEEYRRDRILSNEEEKRLYREAAPHLKPILTCALMTAMRRSEILTLKWENVDLENRQITIKAASAKSGKKRLIPINDTLREELKRLKEMSNEISEFVFLYKGLKTEKFRPLKSVQKAFVRACQRANIKDLVFHDLRRTAASRLIKKGADPISVKKILGHASLKTSEIYLHSSIKQIQEAVNLLDLDRVEKAKNEDDLLHRRYMKEQSSLIH